jgi:hypothetical protein
MYFGSLLLCLVFWAFILGGQRLRQWLKSPGPGVNAAGGAA